MNTSRSNRAGALVTWWERLVAVDVPDPEQRRIGRLFNVVLISHGLLNVLMGLVVILLFVIGGLTQMRLGGWPLLVPFAFFPLLLFCFVYNKRGRSRASIQIYLTVMFLLLFAACLLVDGRLSPIWIVFIWPIMVAGSLRGPKFALYVTLGVIVAYAVVVLLEYLRWYTPLLVMSPENYRLISTLLALSMVIFAGGFLNYLNLKSLQVAFGQVRQTTLELEGVRATLEARVDERTAALERRAEQFRAITELNRAAASILDLQRLVDTVVRLISDRLGYYHVGLFFMDSAGDWAELRAASSEGGQRMLERGHRLRVGQEGIVGYVAQTGLPRFAFDVGEDAVWFNNPDLPETHSEIALPLVGRAQTVIGVLDIQTEERAAFTEEDQDVLRTLANGIAVAVENTRSLEETQETLARLRRYQTEDALQAWRQALARRNMQVGYLYGAEGLVPVGPGAAQQIVPQRELDGLTTEITDEGRHRLLAPVRVQEQHLGVIAFEKSEPWTDDEIQLAQFVIQQLDLALDNARLLEQTRRQANQERARSEIVSRIRALTSTDAILRSAARELGRALQVEHSRIQLLPASEQGRTRAAEENREDA